LREARLAFTAAGMVSEAGLCALRIVETLIERGEDSAAKKLTQEVIDEFTAADLDIRAITAIVGLREAIDVDDATVETVRTVHAFVRDIGTSMAT
jgi:hypothetical protein